MRVLGKVSLSVVAVGAALVAGILIFMALPINWVVGSIWASWSAMLQNGLLAGCVVAVSYFALRAIWRTSKKKGQSDCAAVFGSERE